MEGAMNSSSSRADDVLAEPRVERVVVFGANGAMGARCGVLFAGAAREVTFLARTREKAEAGLARALKSASSPQLGKRVRCASYDNDLDAAIERADLIFEALSEDFDLKRAFFERVDALKRPGSIVATVTSGLSIRRLAEGRSEAFRRHFLGLHFFNPPSAIRGTELIAGPDTLLEIADFVEAFATEKLGRVVVRTADTPGFAGNRVGFKLLNEAAQLAEQHGPLLLDRVLGPYTGRALAPLATIDLVGWDVHQAIVDNLYEHTRDEAHATLELPESMRRLIAGGTLGRKSGGGFFKRDESKRTFCLDLETGRYVPADEVRLPDLGFVERVAALHRAGDHRGAWLELVRAPEPSAALARRVIAGYIAYAFERVGEVTASIHGIDRIMASGFNWAPPGALVDTIGLDETQRMIERAGVRVPAALAGAPREPRFEPDEDIGRFFAAA
jgi:3-hydroxyacyl-CoA dehydrogenase